jgi:N-methylhydantoinase A
MISETTENNILVGVDVGGTFTDFVLFDFERKLVFSHKELTTPENPAEAILRGLPKILQQAEINPKNLSGLVHGSTVATNALLEGKGAKTALISTKGFRDIYQIGRQNRLDLYNLQVKMPSKLVSDHLRMEVEERILPDGHVETTLVNSKKEIKKILETNQVESVAISLLFSFANPKHEIEVSKWLESTGLFVSRSSEVLPEFREYERTSTTVINAYVSPVMAKYLNHLLQSLPQTPIRVMQSNGGTIRVEEAQRFGVRCILSGPAGGIAAAEYLKKILPNQNNLRPGIITFDMGGTSTDVSLIKDKPSITKELEINHLPIGIPVLDIHTIGAGGGSIAVLDSGGALQVGPESAGANPGPACYGVGRFPTVTDANVFLGRLCLNILSQGISKFPERKQARRLRNSLPNPV